MNLIFIVYFFQLGAGLRALLFMHENQPCFARLILRTAREDAKVRSMLMSKYLAETFLTCFLFINKESDHYCSNCYSNNYILNYSRPVMLKRCLTATFGKNVWYMPSAQVLDDTFNRIYSICEDQRK